MTHSSSPYPGSGGRGLDDGRPARENKPNRSRRREVSMTSEPNGGDGTGISPNIALLVGAVAYALVNFVAVMSLILRFMGDPFSVLRFFAFVAPVAA